jgi:hypothetical protein
MIWLVLQSAYMPQLFRLHSEPKWLAMDRHERQLEHLRGTPHEQTRIPGGYTSHRRLILPWGMLRSSSMALREQEMASSNWPLASSAPPRQQGAAVVPAVTSSCSDP